MYPRNKDAALPYDDGAGYSGAVRYPSSGNENDHPLLPLRKLQQSTQELEEFLKRHVAGIQRLQEAITKSNTLFTSNADTNTPTPAPARTGPTDEYESERNLQAHSQALSQFFGQHLHNIETLRASLGTIQLPSTTPEIPSVNVDDETRSIRSVRASYQRVPREDNSSGYSTIVLMHFSIRRQSTFTASLIVAFLQLMYDMLPPVDPSAEKTHYSMHYHMGFGFGLVSLVWNLCVAIVAGANTVVHSSPRYHPSEHIDNTNTITENLPIEHRSPEPEISIVVDDGATSDSKLYDGDHMASDIGLHLFKHNPSQKDIQTKACRNKHTAKERYARRSVAFALAQFFGAAIFGVCIGLLYYPLHSGHILAFVPMFLLTAAMCLAGWDLIKGVERKRARAL